MNIKLEDFDLSQGVLNEEMLEAVDFLTIRSIQWQNHYAREAGEPEWTDAQIERVYGSAALAQWKMHQARQAARAAGVAA